jgi:hypothetical protein
LSTCASKDFCWRNLEEIELYGIRIVDEQLVYMLATFPKLRTLKLRSMLTIKDELFGYANFPLVENLIIENCPTISAAAIGYYMLLYPKHQPQPPIPRYPRQNSNSSHRTSTNSLHRSPPNLPHCRNSSLRSAPIPCYLPSRQPLPLILLSNIILPKNSHSRYSPATEPR